MVPETEFNSMIWPSTTLSGCSASWPRCVRTRLPGLPDNSTALIELEPMSKPTRFFLADFLLNMRLSVPCELWLGCGDSCGAGAPGCVVHARAGCVHCVRCKLAGGSSSCCGSQLE